MIDLHNHLLPGADDGARSEEESAQLLAAYAARDIAVPIVTPHLFPGRYANTEASLAARFAAWPQAPGRRLAAEYFLDAELAPRLEAADPALLTLDASHRYVLIECEGFTAPLGLRERVFRMKLAGLTPVLAHPERYAFIRKDPAFAAELVAAGMVFQGTLRPLAGLWDLSAKRTLKALLDAHLLHLVASDLHREREVERVLGLGLERLTHLAGERRARVLTQENPARLLAGEPLTPV